MSAYKPDKMILTAGPSITDKEISYVTDAVTNGWNDQWNRYITRFESTFAEYIGCKHALSLSSCTGGLHLALAALDIGPGDEVILPELTWIATCAAVRYVGATPVFVDVEPDTWCINPDSIEQAITKRTKAIIPVHLYGHPCNMVRICDLAKRAEIAIVEDAAPSLGANIEGRRTGAWGDVGVFSFQGAKIAVTGEGGMLVTNDSDVFGRIKGLSEHGRDPNRADFWIREIGYKYKMSNLQAALGLAQLERIEDLVEKKRQIYSWYQDGLGAS